jgi:hypothetical protein
MRFSPLSFLLGVAAASFIPLLSRVMRPLAVEATAAGMGMLADARRIAAEQAETLEDIVAEARARREHLDAESMADEREAEAERETEQDRGAAATRTRRSVGVGRRRAS